MKLYRKRTSQPFRWLLALILFGLALTVTFEDVEGVNVPSSGQSASGQKEALPPAPGDTTDVVGEASFGYDAGDEHFSTDTPPPDVPEPTTLLLLASGLGTMYMLRRRKAK